MMRSTMSKLFLVPALAAAAALIPTSAKAETIKVPFNFSAQGRSFPAGTYTIERNRSMVTLHAADSGKSFTGVLGPGDPQPNDDRIVLTFTDSDAEHVLDTIQYRNKVSHVTAARHHRAESTTSLGQ